MIPFLPLASLTWLLMIVAAKGSTIALGSRITSAAGSAWQSQNGTFAMKFYPAAAHSSQFHVGIVFNSISEQTVAWTAGSDVQAGDGSSLQLTQDGNLVLQDPSSPGTILWSSNTSKLSITGAQMLDTGNFVLLNRSSNIAWQTFSHPTDTLLQGQQLNTGQFLTASMYTAAMESSGNLALKWNNQVTYWVSGTASEAASYAVLGQNSFELHNSTNQILYWDSKDYTDTSIMIRRIKLDKDGNLRMYGWSASASWVNEWQAVQDQCYVYGWCGAYGMCSYNSTSPICTCPTSAGFVPVDASDVTKGCRRQMKLQNCDKQMGLLNHTILLDFAGNTTNSYNAGESECMNNCLKNSYCDAATAFNDGSGRCHLILQQSLVTGYTSPQILSLSSVKICIGTMVKSPPASNSSSKSSVSSKVLALAVSGAILGTLLAIILLQGTFWFWCCKNNPKLARYAAPYSLLDYDSGAPMQFTFNELQIATGNFKDKLGEGGFGTVYLGRLSNRMEVAVKQLQGVDQGEKQFRTEVAIIGSTHHVNLVQLKGFCAEGKHRLLVYEYMKNGSLDKYLFDWSGAYPTLDWKTRFNILIGTARGIMYLHQECRDCIIHCDIKPENILLDENFNAKVSDFGLAKLKKAGATTTVRGTRGYLAPEWRSNLPITTKSDVYSFGMVILETLSGRRSIDTFWSNSVNSSRKSEKRLLEWAYDEYFERRNIGSVVDDRMQIGEDNMEELERAMRVGYWCLQIQPSTRPVMRKVVQILEGTVGVDIPPMPSGEFSYASSTTEGDIGYMEMDVGDASKQPSVTNPSITTPQSGFQYSVVSGR